MPIQEEVLNQEQNYHLKVTETATPLEALAALKEQNGALWWHLVVEYDDRWGAIKFVELDKWAVKMGPDFFLTPFSHLPIPPAQVVDQAAKGTRAAKNQARKSQNKLLVVTQNNRLKGILYMGAQRKGQFAAPLLPELYGSPSLTEDDIRACYQDKASPTLCPHCNRPNYVDYDPENGVFRCHECKEIRE